MVVDDSRTPAARAANRAILRGLAGGTLLPSTYCGPVERRALARGVAKATGAPPPLVELALCGVTGWTAPGALRNTILLLTQGEWVLQTDDDTRAQACMAPNFMAGPPADYAAAAAERGPFEMHFLSPSTDLDRDVEWRDIDVFSAHETFLGRGRQGDVAAVRVTQTGIVGDSGAGFPGAMLFLTGKTQERLVACRSVYRRAIAGARTLRSYPRPMIVRTVFCMSTQFALDNTGILPPFMPVWRNEDGIFGWLCGTCLPQARTAFLPIVVRHERPSGHRRSGLNWEEVGRSTCVDLLLRMLARVSPPGQYPAAARLDQVGQELAGYTAAPPRQFRGMLVEEHHRFVRAQTERLQELEATGGSLPAFWKADVQRYLTTLRGRRTASDASICVDAPGGASTSERVGHFRRVIRQYASLLRWWPAFVEPGRALADKPESETDLG